MASGPIERVASAARTTTGNSAAIMLGSAPDRNVDTEGEQFLNLLCSVTAVGGTPSMTLTVEWSHDGGAVFATADPVDTFTAITTAVAKVKGFTIKAPHYRIVWTISGGTPSLTFSIREYTA